MDRPDPGYLTRGDSAPRRLAVGGLLAVLGVTWPLLLGYAVAVMRATFRGETAPPDIDEWAPILQDGAIGTGIVVTFAVPSILLGWLLGWPGPVPSTGDTLVLFVVALPSAYVLPAALARFAHGESLAAGLDLWTLLDVVLLPAYARTWLLVTAVLVAVVAGASVLARSITAPGSGAAVWLCATLLGYVVSVVGARAVGGTYAQIMRLEADDAGVTRQSRADATD